MGGDTTRVLIAGGGVAALEAALALRALAGEHVSVELLAPEPRFWYRPMSVAEPFGLGETRSFDLAELAAAAGASFTPGALAGIDPAAGLAHTTTGAVGYDALLIACGAAPRPAIPGALTFRGPADTDRLRDVVKSAEAGELRRLAFVVPAGAVWALPAYELALMTAARAPDVDVLLVTPERSALALFGPTAGDAVDALLSQRGIQLHAGVYAERLEDGELMLAGQGSLAVDAVIALPRLRGGRIEGVPQNVEGFIPVDAQAAVVGIRDVYAAGDITAFPVKQGGIAAQQAEAAARTIAAAAGADVQPGSFRPVLRGLLLTGGVPRYLRREITGGFGETSFVGEEPLWWPPAKVVGRYLAPFLAAVAGVEAPPALTPPAGAVAIEVELDATGDPTGGGSVVRRNEAQSQR
jgi:sulfide:quinone oxidoreductase